ncbi:MAG: hypothetical protein GY792_30445 [Gammaproteobacteria bacterium]|nr:hypothetical protein [Gammaproteobacteria bacterium]
METKRRTQLQFTPTPELRQVIEDEAKEIGLSVSAYIRTKLLDVFHDQVEKLKQKSNGSN